MKPADIPFDREHYQIINTAREKHLRKCVSQIPFRGELSTALDVGCGAGYFSDILHQLGFSVTGLDLRDENIEVCRKRYPDVKFGSINLDEDFGDIGTYDIVLMFGILYHLVSPLQTILRLSKAIGRIGVISTRVASGGNKAMYLFNELQGAGHNIARTTVVPTFPAIISIFRTAGFEFIYLPREQPDHFQWSPRFGNGRRYSFVVSREPLDIPQWKLIDASRAFNKWEPMRLCDWFTARGLKAIIRKCGF